MRQPIFRPDQEICISNNILMNYSGRDRRIVIPPGVTKLSSSVFWNCTTMEEVVIPNTVCDLGGDTFFRCQNLRTLAIPSSVRHMGDNPFALCPELELSNQSPYFTFENGGLYDTGKSRLIYYAMKSASVDYSIPDSVISIGKHAFVECKALRRVLISPRVRIMENNPFSNLPLVKVENRSPHFHFIDGVLYSTVISSRPKKAVSSPILLQ